MQLQFFESIKIGIPYRGIYARLGYSEGTTQLADEKKAYVEGEIEEAFSLLALRGVALRVRVREITKEDVVLSKDGIRFKSTMVSSLLGGASEILLMGVTAGTRIIETIQKYAKNDLTKSVIYDAVASESADGCFDWICDYYAQVLRRENKGLLAKRVSCGYGDFSLENQKTIYDLLQLYRLGIAIGPALILTPEKSATALTGIIQQ